MWLTPKLSVVFCAVTPHSCKRTPYVPIVLRPTIQFCCVRSLRLLDQASPTCVCASCTPHCTARTALHRPHRPHRTAPPAPHRTPHRTAPPAPHCTARTAHTAPHRTPHRTARLIAGRACKQNLMCATSGLWLCDQGRAKRLFPPFTSHRHIIIQKILTFQSMRTHPN